MNFGESLKKNKELAKEGGGSYENLPCDTYNVKLIAAFVNKSKGGRNQTNFDWEVVEGDLTGKGHRAFHNLDHDVGQQIYSQDMEKMGYDAAEGVETLQDVDKMIKKLASQQPICTITIYEKKGFRNTKIVEFLGFNEDTLPAAVVPDAPATPAGVVQTEPEAGGIEIGAKLLYKVGDKQISGVVKSIDYDKETLDFPFHKGVKLDDVVGAA